MQERSPCRSTLRSCGQLVAWVSGPAARRGRPRGSPIACAGTARLRASAGVVRRVRDAQVGWAGRRWRSLLSTGSDAGCDGLVYGVLLVTSSWELAERPSAL